MPEKNFAATVLAAMPSLPEGDRYLTPSEVSEMAGLSIATLRDYQSTRGRRHGPAFHKCGKTVLYRLTEINDWMASKVTHHEGR